MTWNLQDRRTQSGWIINTIKRIKSQDTSALQWDPASLESEIRWILQVIGYHCVQLKDRSVKPSLTSEELAAGLELEAIAWAKTADDGMEVLQAGILHAMPDWQDPWFFARPA